MYLRIHMLVLAAFACLALQSGAETEIDVGGQVRARSMADKRTLAPDGEFVDLSELRTRVSVTATVDSNTQVYVQFQDSRVMGGDDLSGTVANGEKVDVHQAYVNINELWKNGIGLKAGRFEVNLGNQRVFGSVGWHNVGRSWDGFNVYFARPAMTVDLYWLKRRETQEINGFWSDADIVGANARLLKYGLEFFFMTEVEKRSRPTGPEPSLQVEERSFDRYNLGFYGHQIAGRIDVEYNAVYQFGTDGLSVVDQDIAAFLLTAEFGYVLNTDRTLRVAAGVDYASGDDNLGDGKIKSYDNLYYTGHKFRGYMDYFVAGDRWGLLDVFVRGHVAPAEGWIVKTDLHLFQSAADRFIGSERTGRGVGTEVDVTVATTRIAGVKVVGGASAFFPSVDYAGDNTDPGLWAYGMVIADF